MAQLWSYTGRQVAFSASTALTLAEIIPGAGTKVKVVRWTVSFNQFNAAQTIEVQWVSSTGPLTTPVAQSATPWQAGQGTARATVNVSAASENFTLANSYDTYNVPITSGIVVPYDYGRELEIPVSTVSFRLRILPGTTGGNCDWQILTEE